VPELPEVEGLVTFLRAETVGAVVAGLEFASISLLKTFDPPPSAVAGLTVTGVERHGKWIDLDIDGLHLVFHLSKGGWVRWSEKLATTRLKLGNGPLAMRFRLDRGDGPHVGFDLTEAGTRKAMAVYLVGDPLEVPAIAALGPDPLVPGFDIRPLVEGRRKQIKGLLRDQKVVAGIGNAYSDEILHVARLSPFAISGQLDDAELERLQQSVVEVLADAVEGASGRPAAELKDAKRRGMRVHGRTGEACPVCGDTVREVAFADSSLQYCPTCQTDGKLLANRSTSKFLK